VPGSPTSRNELGTTTIYVTHAQVEAMTVGDRVAVIRRGGLGRSTPRSSRYLELAGEPPQNRFRPGNGLDPYRALVAASWERLTAHGALAVATTGLQRAPSSCDVEVFPRGPERASSTIDLPRFTAQELGRDSSTLTRGGRRSRLGSSRGGRGRLPLTSRRQNRAPPRKTSAGMASKPLLTTFAVSRSNAERDRPQCDEREQAKNAERKERTAVEHEG
jgi:hypothetical protein